MAHSRPGERGRSSAKQGTKAPADQLTLIDWEQAQAQTAKPIPDSPTPAGATLDAESSEALDRLAEMLAPRLAEKLSARLPAPSGQQAATAKLLTLDELVSELPPGKQPQTWKRWLYERTRRGEVPGCVKLGGMLFFEREPTLAWLRAGAASTR